MPCHTLDKPQTLSPTHAKRILCADTVFLANLRDTARIPCPKFTWRVSGTSQVGDYNVDYYGYYVAYKDYIYTCEVPSIHFEFTVLWPPRIPKAHTKNLHDPDPGIRDWRLRWWV